LRTILGNKGAKEWETSRECGGQHNAVMVKSPPPVWIDLPGIGGDRDGLLALCRRLKLPEETVSYWSLRYSGPRVVVHRDSIFIVCHLAVARKRDLFFPYQVRMFARPDLVLTAHGSSRGKTEPLQHLLPALEGVIDAGPQDFAAALLRGVTTSYGQVLDCILDRAPPILTNPGPATVPRAPRLQRLTLFLRRLREQRSLLLVLRGPGSRFFNGGYPLLDELTATLVSVEIGAAAIAEVCGRKRQARKLTEVTDG